MFREYDEIKMHSEKLGLSFIPPIINPLLYQYRDFESFWNIIKSDSFWATDARFSNDWEERQKGQDIGDIMFPRKTRKKPYDDKDHYIVCFSLYGDRLSQWRGYATYGGVSFGMDYGLTSGTHLPFYIINPATDATNTHMLCYLKPRPIYYATDGNTPEFHQYLSCDEARSPMSMETFKVQFPTISRDVKICLDPNERAMRVYPQIIPYIKNIGFEEEAEYRLVVNQDYFSTSGNLRNFVQFRDSGHQKIPYIVLRAGNPKYDNRECVVRIRTNNQLSINETGNFINELKDILKAADKSNDVFSCDPITGKELTDLYCFGCTRRHLFSPGLRRSRLQCRYGDDEHKAYLGRNEPASIIISQGADQERVFELIYDYVHKLKFSADEGFKLWCEGHLPIREVIVGPCEKPTETFESIENFFKNSRHYWLRDVEVKQSAIPYRTPATAK